MNYLNNTIITSLISILLTGCGGVTFIEDDVTQADEANHSQQLKEAVLLDSAVWGARYDAGNGIKGTTDKDGVFKYSDDHEVSFWAGDIFIGRANPVDKPSNIKATRDKIVTPFELVGSTDRNLSNQEALKIAQFLISLDRDDNVDNGIEIDPSRLKHQDTEQSISDSSLEDILLDANSISKGDAKRHLAQSLSLSNSDTNGSHENPDPTPDKNQTNPSDPDPDKNQTKPDSTYDLKVNEPYSKQAEPNSTLTNPPLGMTINPKTGLITWTPTPNQVGDVSFEVKSGDAIEIINLKVEKAEFDNTNIVFISPNGDNDNNGSYDAPLENTKKLCTNIDSEHPDLIIYYRGGVYHNPNFGSGDKNNPSIPQVKCSGTKNHRVTLKPWGNEKAKIEHDSSTALRLTGHYINIEGFEIKGVGDKISYKEAVSNWWRGDNYYNGNGIAVNGHHVDIKNNILGYIPAQAISVKRADYVTIENNIVYNSAWWSVGGTNAMSINDSVKVDDANVTHHKFISNLIFGVESRIYSRVWKKGFAHLTIDEGGGILAQINAGNYKGRYLIENNMVLYTGKGIIANKTHKVDMLHNTIYNSGTTMTGSFRGLRGNDADGSIFRANAVTIADNEGMTLSLSRDTKDITSEENCAIKGDRDKFTDGFTYVDKLFSNPAALDFSIDSNNECAKTVGVPSSVWSSMKKRAKEYGIEIKPSNYVVDYEQQSQDIVNAIPQGATIDWSEYNQSEPSHITVTNLPNDVEGRPSSFRLDFIHPFQRVDLAHLYGKATQGVLSGTFYQPASNAIDNNDSTWNQTTDGVNGRNWLQIELPHTTKIDKIVIQNTKGHAIRLTNAKVYLSDTPFYNGASVDDKELIGTLQPTLDEQTIEINPPKSAIYLLIKGEKNPEGDRNLHLTKVEVYGTAPKTPAIIMPVDNFTIKGDGIKLGDIVAKVDAVDYQDDSLSYTILGNTPFEINTQGEITINQELQESSYTFDVEVSDGINSTTKSITINITSDDSIKKVLASGDILSDPITQEELIDAMLREIESYKTFMKDEKIEIFNLNADGSAKSDGSSLTSISWNPTKTAAHLEGKIGQNIPLLYSNATAKEGREVKKKAMAFIGVKEEGKYTVFANNPFRNIINSDMNSTLENTFSWLTDRDDLKTKPFNVVLAHIDNGIFKDEISTRKWLDEHYDGQVNYNSKNSCDNRALETCLDSITDLLIISQSMKEDDDIAYISATVKKALDDGIPVIYIHYKKDLTILGKILLESVFDIEYIRNNYKNELTIEDYNPFDDMGVLTPELESIKRLYGHFKNKDFSFDWSECTDHGEKCEDITGLQREFQDGASLAKLYIDSFDMRGENIFETKNYNFYKLLTLNADKFRQTVKYPMSRGETDDTMFMQSFYSDHVVYNSREVNPKQLDLGNFSRVDFSHITPTTKTVYMKTRSPFRAVGAYALPGESIKVTRLDDNSSVDIRVFINTLRSGATHQYYPDYRYNRPKYLHSQEINIKPNETITITSPYGGPIEVTGSINGAEIILKLENIGEHPFWSETDTDTNKDEKFQQAIDANEYDWAEIQTSSFEVHSKRDKIIESLEDIKWKNPQALAQGTKTYASNYPMSLAGYNGEGIDIIDEAKSFADAHEVLIYTADFVKHMNADQSTCGMGCSGNPYDAFWAFDPASHGDIHEVGHSLQIGKFLLDDWGVHAATNFYPYYTQMRYNQNIEADSSISNKSDYYISNDHVSVATFKNVFEKLQNSLTQDNPRKWLEDNLWKDASYRTQSLFIIESMMYAQKYATGDYALHNGFHLLTRLHILNRFLQKDAKKGKNADARKISWSDNRSKIGFGSYSLDEIEQITSNDWFVISVSFATGLDYRPFFDMYGISYSDTASNQVAEFNFPAVQKLFFAQKTDSGLILPDDGSGSYLDKTEIEVNNSSIYPY